ncbi:MAG TPA: hypothetical protein VNA89_06445 [Gemmatimonadaceae bacterium]|nr:hypothetical protein [Gemmatimonadaceae bacterium]
MADAAPRDEAPPSRWRYLSAVWFAIVGYFAGGMVAVFVAQVVGYVTRCRPPEGYPACNFQPYFQVGTAVGLVTLPGLIIWRMWQSDAARRNSQRG